MLPHSGHISVLSVPMQVSTSSNSILLPSQLQSKHLNLQVSITYFYAKIDNLKHMPQIAKQILG